MEGQQQKIRSQQKNRGYDTSRRELFVSQSSKRRVIEREVALVCKHSELMDYGEEESLQIDINGSTPPTASDEKIHGNKKLFICYHFYCFSF